MWTLGGASKDYRPSLVGHTEVPAGDRIDGHLPIDKADAADVRLNLFDAMQQVTERNQRWLTKGFRQN
jgi:hypothetical protein